MSATLMTSPVALPLQTWIDAVPLRDPQAAVLLVDLIIKQARATQASDVHLQPAGDALLVSWRVDGVLRHAGRIALGLSGNVVSRLKVLADLLTYRVDVPQEGRIKTSAEEGEIRVSTFPTLHGERGVIRLFATVGRLLRLEDLGLPADVADSLARGLGETSGAILLTGPAGSGKTTTIYACLRELAAVGGGTRSLTTLEDPIEVAVPWGDASAGESLGRPDPGDRPPITPPARSRGDRRRRDSRSRHRRGCDRGFLDWSPPC